jgi:hypothetical protein
MSFGGEPSLGRRCLAGMLKHTVIISTKGKLYKICKIWYGSDGSYYVTVPYHSANQAVLLKQTVNYVQSVPTSVDHQYVTLLDEAIDVGSSDDARIKLSHHPDGFIQFSGHGLLSGKNADGTPKGIGIYSWPLKHGCRGPAFSLSVGGIEQFQPARDDVQNACVLNYDDLTVIPGSTEVVIDGHYFPLLWRRFIRARPDGKKYIPIVHPAGVILELPVLLPGDNCPIGGFIGLEFYGGIDREPSGESGYCISSSTGNVRMNEKGEKLGDGLFCLYPRPHDLPTRRSLDYRMPSSPDAEAGATPHAARDVGSGSP